MSIDRHYGIRSSVAAAAFLLGILVNAGTESASRFAVSHSPYWAVGARDENLSRACQNGRFNQIQHYRVYIAFEGERGRGIVGVARKDSNLYDPGGLAVPGVYYHFHNDGYADCRVFVAG